MKGKTSEKLFSCGWQWKIAGNFTEKEDESMAGWSRIRTDLALEATERFQEENV